MASRYFLGWFYCFIFSACNHVDFSDGSIHLELANQGLRRRQTSRPQIVTILTGNACRGFYILKLFHLGIIFYISDIKKLATSEAICSKCQGHIYCSEAPALNMMWPHWQGPFEDIDDIDIDIEDGKDHLKIFHVIVQLNRTWTNQFSPQKPRMPREMRKKVLPS